MLDPHTRVPDYDDDSKTENTRAAYPVDFIDNAVIPGDWRPSQERRVSDRRCVRRPASDIEAYSGAGDVPLLVRLHREGGWDGSGYQRAVRHVLDLLRVALLAVAAENLC